MHLPFLGPRHKKNGDAALTAGPEGLSSDPEALAALLSECELLRSQAERAGVRLDGSPASLEALDQMAPRWRDDPETLPGLGHDAGLYLGTVVVRTVPGAGWRIRPDGEPVVRLASGRAVEVVPAGQEWAACGVPELSQLYAEIAET
ncbi:MULTISPECIES: DUF6278 family protein [Streptomyces]|uniref:DUF6278 family protein n=1 Tax=Streptomyces TaxID=1883 RepID=UPI0016714C12|nr:MULTISPECIES: DUF6278 family protein [Streptomyces]UFR01276.1 DUF6278 family protein [Streptomyces sp. Go40/10]GGS91041.1 hypothetical protein GCM10010206_62210 [Streptomyces cinerochromogenes]